MLQMSNVAHFKDLTFLKPCPGFCFYQTCPDFWKILRLSINMKLKSGPIVTLFFLIWLFNLDTNSLN